MNPREIRLRAFGVPPWQFDDACQIDVIGVPHSPPDFADRPRLAGPGAGGGEWLWGAPKSQENKSEVRLMAMAGSRTLDASVGRAGAWRCEDG